MLRFRRARVNRLDALLIIEEGDRSVVRIDGQAGTLARFDAPTNLAAWIRDKHVTDVVETELKGGRYYPRVWRGDMRPHPERTPFGEAWRASVRIGHMLGGRLQEMFRYIEPHERNRKAFGHELRMLFLQACMEVESACKAVMVANDSDPREGSHFNIKDYRRLAQPMRLWEWCVRLSTNPLFGNITPFLDWAPNGSQRLKWYADHNTVKHNREKELRLATLENTITALAGVYVLRLAQFGKFSVNFDATTPFTRDEFEVFSEPKWLDSERYIDPGTLGPSEQPVAPRWMRKKGRF
jgi:hypothetical protein